MSDEWLLPVTTLDILLYDKQRVESLRALVDDRKALDDYRA